MSPLCIRNNYIRDFNFTKLSDLLKLRLCNFKITKIIYFVHFESIFPFT